MAVSWHARGGRGSLCIGSFHGLRICLVENSLEHLLLFSVKDLGQILIQLWLFLLEACNFVNGCAVDKNSRSEDIPSKTCLNNP